jgi:hypothetical protein
MMSLSPAAQHQLRATGHSPSPDQVPVGAPLAVRADRLVPLRYAGTVPVDDG